LADCEEVQEGAWVPEPLGKQEACRKEDGAEWYLPTSVYWEPKDMRQQGVERFPEGASCSTSWGDNVEPPVGDGHDSTLD
jgi:hypothetical protein